MIEIDCSIQASPWRTVDRSRHTDSNLLREIAALTGGICNNGNTIIHTCYKASTIYRCDKAGVTAPYTASFGMA
jgi:hypothetical protein